MQIRRKKRNIFVESCINFLSQPSMYTRFFSFSIPTKNLTTKLASYERQNNVLYLLGSVSINTYFFFSILSCSTQLYPEHSRGAALKNT